MSGRSGFHILQTAHQSSGTDRHAQTVLAPTRFVKHIRQVSATHSAACPSIRSGLRDLKRPLNTACTPRLVGSCPSNVALTLLGKVLASAPKPLASSRLLERPALILALRRHLAASVSPSCGDFTKHITRLAGYFALNPSKQYPTLPYSISQRSSASIADHHDDSRRSWYHCVWR